MDLTEHYAAILADLKAKRAILDQFITSIESAQAGDFSIIGLPSVGMPPNGASSLQIEPDTFSSQLK